MRTGQTDLSTTRRPRGTAGPRRRWQQLVFRLLAILCGFLLLAAGELALTILDLGNPRYEGDPFVGFSAVYPLFVLNEQGTRFETDPARLDFFRPESFAAAKPPDEYRIFCLGGSTVQGRPFAIETSFTTWLEIGLRAADPSRRWEVVNCGGVSYASYRLVPILKEVLTYQPDLIILYTGHNEFLEDRSYDHIKQLPSVVAVPWQWVVQTRTYGLLRQAYVWLRGGHISPPPKRPVLGPETDAVLEYRDGLQQYHRDDKWRDDVIAHFSYNVRRMVQLAHDAGVPLLLINPVSNLRDCPPFKTQDGDHLTPQQLRQRDALLAEARSCAFPTAGHHWTDLPRAVTLLQEALAIDNRHAGIHYLLATCLDTLGRMDEARQAYIRAKDEDICPLRILEPMHAAILRIAKQTKTPLVDVRELFRRHSRSGIPDNSLLLDHVHPSIRGHRMIAETLIEELIRQGIVRPTPGWQQRAQQQGDAHFKSLGDFYFVQGMQRLEALQLWTQGKGRHVRPPDNKK